MKKLIPILALIPLVFLALAPPLRIALDCGINTTFYLWTTFFAGFLALLFLYQKVSVWLRLLVLWCFVTCFLSNAPFLSFGMYWSLIFCAYYYVLCRKIQDWGMIKRVVQSIFLFVILMALMQAFGKDTLINFNTKEQVSFGIIGNPMMASTFTCILAPFLIFNPLNFVILGLSSFILGSSGAMLSTGMGILVYGVAKFKRFRIWIITIAILIPLLFAWKTGDFSKAAFRAGRLPVYKKTIELALKRPMGYGLGTYKILFPVMCGTSIRDEQPGRHWSRTHNDWLQILFETGFPGVILLLGWLVSIVVRVKNPIKLAGLAILATNMMIHFPNRMVQGVLIIMMFLAYCSKGETLCEE